VCVRVCIFNADLEGVERHNSTAADKPQVNSCESSTVKRPPAAVHRDLVDRTSPHDAAPPSSAAAAVPGPSSRPRPVRQSTGGRLLFARHGTTAPRPGDDTGADGGLPTETAAGQQPTRRASAPSYTGTSSTPATAAVSICFCGTICSTFNSIFQRRSHVFNIGGVQYTIYISRTILVT